jgi:hypothetical protein
MMAADKTAVKRGRPPILGKQRIMFNAWPEAYDYAFAYARDNHLTGGVTEAINRLLIDHKRISGINNAYLSCKPN